MVQDIFLYIRAHHTPCLMAHSKLNGQLSLLNIAKCYSESYIDGLVQERHN